MKEDVEDSIPPLQETIIDVEMTTIQKQLYRAVYEKNKTILTRDYCNVNFNTSLNNLEIQLRKICNHPLLINEFEQQLTKDCITQDDYLKQIVQNSGKMIFLDKFLQKMRAENKKVLIFSQFINMLNILEEYLKINNYKYEKLDGTVKSKDRQSSIDRFNQLDKKREVFLLSTKAGGIGINLTAANVVIIFDSDWNPQNDVQATARAHRIGQTQDVKVYRLITCKTYEAHMFERASKKLGLDQAIFLGGAFQNQDDDKNKKLSKNEIEVLLKKGILGFLDEDQGKEQSFKEDNIELILEKNSRIAKYSLIGNSYTVSKSTFISDQSDIQINIDDPNFWQNVLKSKVSQGQQLLEQTKNIKFKNAQDQLQFMENLSKIVGQVVESKLIVAGYSADEEKIAMNLCQYVQGTKYFEKQYQELAFQWQIDIERPSRRFKKFNSQDIQFNKLNSNSQSKNKIADDEIFNDSQKNESSESNDENQIKLSQNEQYDLLKRICSVCHQQNCTFFCQSFCKRAFHSNCKNLAENSLQNDKQEFINDKEKLRKQIQLFTCLDCLNNQITCFKCKKKETIGLQINKCGTSKCHKYYHNECLKNQPNIHFVDKQKMKIRCSLHYCQICGLNGENTQLYSCLQCPKAYHLKCIDNVQVTKIGKKQIICHNHKQNSDVKLQSQIKDSKKIEKKIKDDRLTILDNNDDIIDIKIEKKKNNRKENKQKSNENNDKNKKISKYHKYDYKTLDLENPDSFDYKNHQNDWCRYCGARYSSNFTKGPWGPRTLCTIHYIVWNQKKTLNLSSFKEMPIKPINLNENTELNFISNMKIKNQDFDFKKYQQEVQKLKKVKIDDINYEEKL